MICNTVYRKVVVNMKKIALITSTANYERHKDTIRAIHAKLKQMGGYALYVLTSYGIFFNESAYDKGEQSIYSLLDEVEFDGCIIDSNLGRDKLFKHIIDKLKAKKIPFVAIVGGDEMAAGKAMLKNMQTGEQQLVGIEEALMLVRG